LAQEKQGANQSIPASIFKAYDIRGIVGETLTDEIVYSIGRAVASEAHARGQRCIVIGRDGRLSGPAFAAALSKGILDAGLDVIDIGMVPSPILYYATHTLGTQSGIMVTGSHNPPAYNGFKIVVAGETLSGADIQALKTRIERQDFSSGEGAYRQDEIIPDYIKRIVGDVHFDRPFKLVVDCGNGVAGVAAPQLLRELGCEVSELYCEVDGRFPNHHPDPGQPENLVDMIEAVKLQGADLGLAFDGDGDRLGVVDSSGNIIWPDRQMMLYSADVLSRNSGATIIYDIKCTRHLGSAIKTHGGEPLMWKTGHSLIKAKMKEEDALLAGEMSGHIFFKERWYGFDDALYTAARLLEILASDPRNTTEIFADLPNALCTPELRIDMQEGEHFRFMEQFIAQAQFPEANITTIDGIRADFEDGWGLIRSSNTTPSLIIRFEADNTEALERIQDEFRRAILTVDASLSLPF